jgi:hypothetical protein
MALMHDLPRPLQSSQGAEPQQQALQAVARAAELPADPVPGMMRTKTMGKPCENHGKTRGFSLGNHQMNGEMNQSIINGSVTCLKQNHKKKTINGDEHLPT